MLSAVLAFASCTKEQLPQTEESVTATTPVSDDISLREPSPGTYTVARYSDAGVNNTSEFSGYSFEFLSEGGILATTPEGNIVGGWHMDYSETTLSISISGSDALDDINQGDWHVERISDRGMQLSAGSERLVFMKDSGGGY